MRRKHLLPLTRAGLAACQSLPDMLAAQNSTLSLLNNFLSEQQSLLAAFSNLPDITVLAPSNAALSALPQSVVDRVNADPNYLPALLHYHVLNGTYYAAALSAAAPARQPYRTLLSDAAPYALVPDGQRVVVQQAAADANQVELVSGLQRTARLEAGDYNFTGGTMHIIDRMLTMPANLTTTLLDGGYTAAVGALRQSGMGAVLDVDQTPLTVLVPDNGGFAAVGSLVADMTAQDLQLVLGYHVVQGRVLYAGMIGEDEAVRTMQGGDVTFRREDGGMFVNGARVVAEDVLMANGVVHIIDNILNPLSPKATPNPTLATQPPAFSGASETGGVPFTTGVTVPPPDPTTSIGTVPPPSSTVAGAAPARTAVAGMAVMFGGAAAFWNM